MDEFEPEDRLDHYDYADCFETEEFEWQEDLAEFNYECQIYREPEKQVDWRKLNDYTNNARRGRSFP